MKKSFTNEQIIYTLRQVEGGTGYFGGRRKGKRGRGAAGKSLVFGLLERQGRVYTKVVVGQRTGGDAAYPHQDQKGFGLLH